MHARMDYETRICHSLNDTHCRSTQELGTSIPRTNDFKELFYVRWGNIWFNVFWGPDLNLKVVLNVYRSCGVCERFIVDTDPHDVHWDRHKRVTRDFYIHPFPAKLGHVTRVTFSYIAHLHNRSIPSQHEYVFFDECALQDEQPHHRNIRRTAWRPTGTKRESWTPANCSGTSTGATTISIRCT